MTDTQTPRIQREKFLAVWKRDFEGQGYCYGKDALENVEFGWEIASKIYEAELAAALAESAKWKADAITLALRLLGEDEHTFSPESAEVMKRLGPICITEAMKGQNP